MNIDEINIIYKVKDKIEVVLFGDKFVERNKKNCNLIIDGKEQDSKSMHNFGIFFGTDKDYFKIKLKGITNITDVSYMFFWSSSLLSLPDISKWNTSNIINMSHMFYHCETLLSLPDISKWNTSNVFDMSYMFYKCYSLVPLPDISKWNTSNVIDMSYMFYQCKSFSLSPDTSY